MLHHKIFGDVIPLESAYFHGQKVLIVRSGSEEFRNVFVGDTRWFSPTTVVERTWETLHGYVT